MKLSLNQKTILYFLFVIPAIILMAAGANTEHFGLIWLGFAVVAADIINHIRWWRCPYCGGFLGRDRGAYCKDCGHEIDYDAKN